MKLKTILIAGHNFHFLQSVIDYYQKRKDLQLLFHQYSGHSLKNEAGAKLLLEKADIIFCEWCLGNALWFSQHKKPGQRLIIRFHRQEIEPKLPFLAKIRWEKVDKIIFIAPKIQQDFLERFAHLTSKCELIYNLIESKTYSLPKTAASPFQLGLLGMVPRLKAPHLAAEILAQLHAHDERFQLFIKGRQPKEPGWMKDRAEEQIYYQHFYKKLEMKSLAQAVTLDPFDKEVPAWFQKIGFILSTSEVEGSHQAVAEGMASGAIPIIRNWPGANLIYPEKYIFESPEEAVALIRKFSQPHIYGQESEFCKEFVEQTFEAEKIFPKYDQLPGMEADL